MDFMKPHSEMCSKAPIYRDFHKSPKGLIQTYIHIDTYFSLFPTDMGGVLQSACTEDTLQSS